MIKYYYNEYCVTNCMFDWSNVKCWLISVNGSAPQHCGTNAIVWKHEWAERRKFGTQCAENIQTVADIETCSIYAESTPSTVRHAPNNGQRRSVFFTSNFVYLHIQVKQLITLLAFISFSRLIKTVVVS